MISMYNLFENDNNRFKIYCDMDGVLTDFDKQAKSIESNIFNLSQKEMWKLIADNGIDFWTNMPWTNDGKKLWNYIKQFNAKILTAAPGLSKIDPVRTNSIKGKKMWVEKNIGKQYLNNLIITTSKEKSNYADEDSILIDDREKLIKPWKTKGGIGILYKSADQVIRELQKLL